MNSKNLSLLLVVGLLWSCGSYDTTTGPVSQNTNPNTLIVGAATSCSCSYGVAITQGVADQYGGVVLTVVNIGTEELWGSSITISVLGSSGATKTFTTDINQAPLKAGQTGETYAFQASLDKYTYGTVVSVTALTLNGGEYTNKFNPVFPTGNALVPLTILKQ